MFWRRTCRRPRAALSRKRNRGATEHAGRPAATLLPKTTAAIGWISAFSLLEVIAEFRALRASVIELWNREVSQADEVDLSDLTRFNEAIDEALAESVKRYWSRIETARNLLLGALGHDLRNPLAAIEQWAHVLLRADVSPGTYASAAGRILHSGKRMSGMVSDLLDFARTQLGEQIPLSPAPIDIGEACRAIMDEMSVLYPEHHLSCEVEGDLKGTWDAGRIGQMLSNLAGNAAEHGARRTPITVKAWSAGSHVQISVHNEGPPIPERDRLRIFEPLARGHEAGRTNAGLGLYIACAIAKAHGGTIELTASDESGTTFTAVLPQR